MKQSSFNKSRLTAGIFLIILGTLWLADLTFDIEIDIPWLSIVAVAVIASGLSMVLRSRD